jgi:small subunit ribosomal protein S6e
MNANAFKPLSQLNIMVFKINVSHNGKTYKLETESEVLVGRAIGEVVKGDDIDAGLKGFELEITGHSDLSGIPGFKGLEGNVYHKRLLTYGPGMKDRRKGMRLRKTNRGEEVSLKTHQVNTKVVKEGEKGFEGLFVEAPVKEEAPAEDKKE